MSEQERLRTLEGYTSEEAQRRCEMIDDLVDLFDEGFDNKTIRMILREGWIGLDQWTDEEILREWNIVYGGEEE